MIMDMRIREIRMAAEKGRLAKPRCQQCETFTSSSSNTFSYHNQIAKLNEVNYIDASAGSSGRGS